MFSPTKDRAFFDRLYQENVETVRGVLYNMTGRRDLDDLTQEVFLKVWKNLPTFAFKSSVKTWVYRISVNVAIDHLRSRPPVSDPVPETLPDEQTAEEISRRSIQRLIQEALMVLNENDRALIVLAYFEDRPLKEIAGILDIPEGTVKSRLHQARGSLKTELERRGLHEDL